VVLLARLHLLDGVEAQDVEALGEDGGCSLTQQQATVVHLENIDIERL